MPSTSQPPLVVLPAEHCRPDREPPQRPQLASQPPRALRDAAERESGPRRPSSAGPPASHDGSLTIDRPNRHDGWPAYIAHLVSVPPLQTRPQTVRQLVAGPPLTGCLRVHAGHSSSADRVTSPMATPKTRPPLLGTARASAGRPCLGQRAPRAAATLAAISSLRL
jgi:hypothetical protein